MSNSNNPSNSTPKPGRPPAKALPSMAISKAVNPPKLLSELQAIGVTGLIQKTGAESFTLTIKTQPATVTTAQIQAIIAAHNPTPAVDPTVTGIDNWANLTTPQKDALMLTALKKLYQVT